MSYSLVYAIHQGSHASYKIAVSVLLKDTLTCLLTGVARDQTVNLVNDSTT